MDNSNKVSVFGVNSYAVKDRLHYDQTINCSKVKPQHMVATEFTADSKPLKQEYKDFKINIHTAKVRRSLYRAPRSVETGELDLHKIYEEYPDSSITFEGSGYSGAYYITKQFAVVDEIVDKYISFLIEDNEDKVATISNLRSYNHRSMETLGELRRLKNRNLFQRIFRVGE